MTNAALFIDLPNFYSGLIRSNIADPRILRDYFLNWLDLPLLARKLTNASPSIWVFYAKGRIGPASATIEDDVLQDYVKRINLSTGVTARDVNIPGAQRETMLIECPHCHQEAQVKWQSEKGIDTSLTVHLFDTMDSWDAAYLLSGDADFVPIVAALRRRGKILIGAHASKAKASSALIQECYDFIDLTNFLSEDVALYELTRKDGVLMNWLCSIKPDPTVEPGELTVSLEWPTSYGGSPTYFGLKITGSADINMLHKTIFEQLTVLQPKFQEYAGNSKLFYLSVDSLLLHNLGKRAKELATYFPGLRNLTYTGQIQAYEVKYRYDHTMSQYQFITQ